MTERELKYFLKVYSSAIKVIERDKISTQNPEMIKVMDKALSKSQTKYTELKSIREKNQYEEADESHYTEIIKEIQELMEQYVELEYQKVRMKTMKERVMDYIKYRCEIGESIMKYTLSHLIKDDKSTLENALQELVDTGHIKIQDDDKDVILRMI